MPNEFHGIFLIACIAVLAPLLNRAPPLSHVPIAAMELVLGVLIGPSGAGLVATDPAIEFLGKLGLLFLFFQAGFEFRLRDLGQEPLRLGLFAWLVSLGAAIALALALSLTGLVTAPLLVAIILPTTAFGVLLPMLRQAGEAGTDFGRYVLGAAAMGEIGPLLLASIALAPHNHHFHQSLRSLLFLVLAAGAVYLLARLRSKRLTAAILLFLGKSDILPVRVAILLLLGFVSLAGRFGMEAVIGAYMAGLAVALLVDGTKAQALEERLTTIGSGFLAPVFFIASGVSFDLGALLSTPSGLALCAIFVAAILVIRTAPLALYRGHLPPRDLPALALLSSTTLPLPVAISYLGVSAGAMSAVDAAAIVGAAVATVTIFPTLALTFRAASRAARPPGGVETAVDTFASWTATQAATLFERAQQLRR